MARNDYRLAHFFFDHPFKGIRASMNFQFPIARVIRPLVKPGYQSQMIKQHLIQLRINMNG